MGERERDAVEQALQRHAGEEGALLPVLHAIQDALGFVPPASMDRIALALNLSRADVHGVLSFYHDFRTRPPGRCVVRICRAEACQSMGAIALITHAEARLGVRMQETRADGAVTLEAVYCLGNCALSPAVLVDGQLHGRVTAERLDALVPVGPAARPPRGDGR